MADNIALIKLEVQVADGEVKVDKLKSKLQQLTKGSDDYNLVVKKIQIAEDNLAETRDKLTKSTQELIGNSKKGLTGVSQAAGAASSAAMELGRVISDAPYGIRGMANNITQLVSQLGFATTAAGGFRAAMRQMWAALMGPLGIVLAITTAVSALEYFSINQKKSKKETDKTTQSLKKQITPLQKLINLYSSLRKVLFTSKDNEAINAFNNNFLSLDETVKVLTRNFSEFKNAYDKLSDDDKKSKDNVKTLVDGYSKLLKFRELEEKQVARMSVLRDDVDKKGRTISRNGLTFLRAEAKELDNLEKAYISTQKELIKLENYFSKAQEDKNGKTGKFSPFKTQKELDLDVKNQEDALLQLEKKTRLQTLRNSELEELSSAKTEKEKTKIKRKYAAQRLEIELSIEEKKLILAKSNERQIAKIKHDEHVAQLKRVLEEYKLKVKLNKPKQASQLISDAESKTQASIVQAGAELIKTYGEIDAAYKPLFTTFEDLAKKRREALGILPDDKRASEIGYLEQYLDQTKQLLSSVGSFISGEYDRQLIIEQNKTNALNAELNKRLLNEQLSADQRKNIQNQIYQNDEALRVKQEAIKKKAFNAEKAFNISSALLETYAAASSAFRNTLANPLNKLLPDAGLLRAKVNAGIATASGLVQVAAIARQKYQSSSAATPIRTGSGGGASGGADRSFNFNLVGNTLGNQITDAIQGQFDKPLKAYVVSRDITSQQALDANIKGTASF